MLYFYPKDDTPGCTTEACNFRDSLPDFTSLNCKVIGVSPDSTSSHKSFSGKYSLNFTLASDTTTKTCQAYGCWTEKSMYGKTMMGVERCTFLIDSTGTIRGIWRKVSVDGHVDTVKSALRSLGSSSSSSQRAA